MTGFSPSGSIHLKLRAIQYIYRAGGTHVRRGKGKRRREGGGGVKAGLWHAEMLLSAANILRLTAITCNQPLPQPAATTAVLMQPSNRRRRWPSHWTLSCEESRSWRSPACCCCLQRVAVAVMMMVVMSGMRVLGYSTAFIVEKTFLIKMMHQGEHRYVLCILCLLLVLYLFQKKNVHAKWNYGISVVISIYIFQNKNPSFCDFHNPLNLVALLWWSLVWITSTIFKQRKYPIMLSVIPIFFYGWPCVPCAEDCYWSWVLPSIIALIDCALWAYAGLNMANWLFPAIHWNC